MHGVLINCLGGLSLPRKSVVRLTDRPDMTLDVYRGRKSTTQQQQQFSRCTSQKSKIYTTLAIFRKLQHEIFPTGPVNLVPGIIRLPSGWDFSVCIGNR